MIGGNSYFDAVKRNFKRKYFVGYAAIIAFTLFLLVFQRTMGLKRSTLIILEEVFYNSVAALSLSLVVGFLGELSLGHAAFMSIGAFVSVYARQTFLRSATEASPLATIVISFALAGVAAAVAGFVIGLPALRLKGDYLAIVTLAFGEIVKSVLKNILAGSESAGTLRNPFRYNYRLLYLVCSVTLLFTLGVILNLIRSKHGRSIMAVRDNEIAAKSTGVNVTYYKLAVFVISAFFAGIAGVLYGASKPYVDAASFDYNKSINILVMVVLGGMGSVNGTIVSAAAVTFFDIKLSTLLTGNLASLKNFFYAMILIFMVIYNNAPALKSFREKYNMKSIWGLVVKHRKLKVELTADEEKDITKADWDKIPTKIEMDAVLSTELKPSNVSGKPDRPRK